MYVNLNKWNELSPRQSRSLDASIIWSMELQATFWHHLKTFPTMHFVLLSRSIYWAPSISPRPLLNILKLPKVQSSMSVQHFIIKECHLSNMLVQPRQLLMYVPKVEGLWSNNNGSSLIVSSLVIGIDQALGCWARSLWHSYVDRRMLSWWHCTDYTLWQLCLVGVNGIAPGPIVSISAHSAIFGLPTWSLLGCNWRDKATRRWKYVSRIDPGAGENNGNKHGLKTAC